MNRLTYSSEGKSVEVVLSTKPVSFGRSDEADHKLPTKLASRIHAQVFPRERGWWIEDLASSNGTLVNGNKILKPMPLAPGDLITVGDVQLKFEGEAAAPKGPPDHLIARILYTPQKGKPPIETLIRDRITIGRKPDNTLQIDSKAVSGNHCEIINRDGVYTLRDLGSSNGTFIKKQPVTEHTLRNGDMIVLGKKIDVYFVDPAGQAAPAAAPAAPAQPAAAGSPPPRAPSSAAGASDRGSFEPIPEALRKANPLPHVLVGVGLGLLFILAGWLLGEVIGGLSTATGPQTGTRTPEAALPDRAMSFEGPVDEHGDPEGWIAKFEAAGQPKVELRADTADPFDGAQSLSISASGVQGTSTLVLQTSQPQKLDLGAAFQLTLALKGEGATKLAISLSALDENNKPLTLAAGSFVGIKGTAWSQFTMTGMNLSTPPANAPLRLLIAGAFTRLWIDRIELVKTADGLSTKPFQGIDAPDLAISFDEHAPACAVISSGERAVRMQPLLLNPSDKHMSEDELWALTGVKPDSLTWSALMAGQGDAAAVRFGAKGHDSGYFSEHGMRLEWELVQGSATLGVRMAIPIAANATISLADRRGYPMQIDARAIHAYAYSTISEVVVGENGISISFPRGASVWFDLSQPGLLLVTARSASARERGRLEVDVNTRPLMHARLYDRLLNEVTRLMETEHHSAAEVRLRWLLSSERADRELQVLKRAQAKLGELVLHREALLKDANDTWQAAQGGRDRARLNSAVSANNRYMLEFPGDAIVSEMAERKLQLDNWLKLLDAQKRPLEEMKIAEADAKRLYDDANECFKTGNYLLAMVLLDTIVRDYADTSQMNNATDLRNEIERLLANQAEQNKVIDAELKRIDEDIKFKDYKDAREKCLALFKRFPNSPRTREIMQKLKAIEDAFE